EGVAQMWQHHPKHDDIEGPQLDRETVNVAVEDSSLRPQHAVGIPIGVLDTVDVPLQVVNQPLHVEARVRKRHAVPVSAVGDVEGDHCSAALLDLEREIAARGSDIEDSFGSKVKPPEVLADGLSQVPVISN